MSRVKITIQQTADISEHPDARGYHAPVTIYTVIKTVNTLQVEVGQKLSRAKVSELIADGHNDAGVAMDVTIVGG